MGRYSRERQRETIRLGDILSDYESGTKIFELTDSGLKLMLTRVWNHELTPEQIIKALNEVDNNHEE